MTLRGPKRLPTVDLLRGLCIIAVVLHHINLRVKFNKSASGAMLPDVVNRILFWNGSYGVKVFFVVSGFLITSTILRRWGSLDGIDVAAFYRLRVARIAPCLVALLAILSILHLAGATGYTINPHRTTLPRALLAALTFHVNWLEIKIGYLPGSWDILWSLAVEETFYIAYPIVCRFVRWRSVLIVGVLALGMAGPFFRTVLAPNEMATDYALLANLDCIAMGCVAALLAGQLPVVGGLGAGCRVIGSVMIVLVTLARPVSAWLQLGRTGLDVTILAAGTALVLMAVRPHADRAPSWSAPVRWFGRNSYEVYLTHMFVVMAGFQTFTAARAPINSAPLWFVGILAVSGLLGHIVATFYSEPLNQLIRHRRRS